MGGVSVQPHCPNGHDYYAHHINGLGTNVSVGSKVLRTIPIYCNLCGHVYGVIAGPAD